VDCRGPRQKGGGQWPFPNYGLTIFQNCTAGTKDISIDLRDACALNLIDGGGKVISQATIDSDTSLTCNFRS
jgi:Peptidase A4 family